MNLKKFQIEDLSHQNSDAIFILESPHTQEIKAGYPAAGETGLNMSKVLFNKEQPLGELVKKRAILPIRLSILNCSRIPLQSSCYVGEQLPPKLVDFLRIQSIFDPSVQRQKNQIKEILRSEIGLNALNSFELRLHASIQMSQKAKVVVCGVIAQCFFEEVTKIQGKLRKATDVDWKGFSFSVFYEYHPSSKSGQWNDCSGMEALRHYVS
ncbi:hypothetical protein EK599_22935 [Vibrio sp. T187]|uniref:hypothetical protein n=1 Tax=Vibrio TaxID=662 RepID=UPI0010C9DD22|nr:MULTISPECIES: hypothetical protein [Vibrio]MBW3698535.1 hypothetical protein [Vibrio sp. T187]